MPPDPPEMTGDDLFPWGWTLLLDSPAHWNCGGWTFDGRDSRVVCACGAPLFIAEVVAA